MPASKKALRTAAARARANRHVPKPTCEVLNDDTSTPDTAGPIIAAAAPATECNLPEVPEHAPECSAYNLESDCGYEGGVNVDLESDDEYIPDSEHDSDFTDSDLSEFDEEVLEALKADLASLSKPTPFEKLTQKKTSKEWKELESNRSLGYNGLSVRKGYRDKAKARHRQEVKQSQDPQVVMMRNMFKAANTPAPPTPVPTEDLETSTPTMTPAEMVYYPSDHSDSGEESSSDGNDEAEDELVPSTSKCLPAVPPLKWRKLEIPAREMQKQKKTAQKLELQKALGDIQKQIKSKKTVFAAGPNSLQEYRARAIQSYLIMVVKGARGLRRSGEAEV
ncbi:hypothetical protein C8J57DRAFT_1223449 [Mycena rebaudengoi]|nr:hypothetical protein C8J57DRAFT_1223449 [Mycena rebaudengoi]